MYFFFNEKCLDNLILFQGVINIDIQLNLFGSFGIVMFCDDFVCVVREKVKGVKR